MEKCKTFTFKNLNKEIGHPIVGKHIFANTQINNVWEFVFFYDLLNENVLHTTLEIDFRKKFNKLRYNLINRYNLTQSEAGIHIICLLKEKNYKELLEYWED